MRYIISVLLMCCLGCESDLAEVNENELGDESLEIGSEVIQSLSDSVKLSDVKVDTLIVEGVIQFVTQDFEVIKDSSTNELDTVFSEPDTLSQEDYDEQKDQEIQEEIENDVDEVVETLENKFASDVYVEAWSGRKLRYIDGLVSGYNLEQTMSLKKVASGESETISLNQNIEIMLIVALQRDDDYYFFRKIIYDASELGEISDLVLTANGVLEY